jgi:hypothetical protein
LTAFPLNWLKRFEEKHVAAVVMNSTQNLADVPLWPAFTPDRCEEMLTQAAPLVDKTVKEFVAQFADIADPEYRAYQVRMAGDQLKENFENLSKSESLGFSVKLSREPRTLEYLAAEHGVDTKDADKLAHWSDAFLRLNAPVVEKGEQDGTVAPVHGFYLVPYEMYKGKPLLPISLADLKSIKGIDLSTRDGANYPENHFFIIHESVAPDPSPHMGHHRVALHESGHMVDWLTKEIPGVGPDHEKKVLELYHLAQAEPSRFLTDRMKDSPGEFFADGVEAYLTLPVADGQDHYKADNNRLELEKRNPELFHHIEWVMSL